MFNLKRKLSKRIRGLVKKRLRKISSKSSLAPKRLLFLPLVIRFLKLYSLRNRKVFKKVRFLVNMVKKKNFKFLLKRKKKRKKKFSYRNKLPFDSTELLNLLKIKSKFQDIQKKFIKYCKIFFKYTGSNFFITITNYKGDVFLSYSAGIFKNLRTRKEKTTIFVAKELGELLGLRLEKLLTKQTLFIPFLNHRNIKTFLRFFFSGVRSVGSTTITKHLPKRKITRNGVRLRKEVRK